jgi:hypothetical protein
MAAADDWVPVSSSSGKDDWTSVSGAAPAQEFRQPGEAQALTDEARVAKERGAIPDELKTALYSAGEMGAFSLPTWASAKISQKKGQSWEDALNEQRAYVEALQRQNPKSSLAGSTAGLVGGMFVPLGPLGTASKLAARGAEAIGAGATGKAIASGTTVGAGFGAGSSLGEKAWSDKLTPGEFAKDVGIGAVGGGILAPIAERIIGRAVSPADAAKTEVLASQGVTPSKEMITGVRAEKGAPRETADVMAEEARNILSQKVEGMKTPDVSPTTAAELIGASGVATREAVQQPYKTLKGLEGSFNFGEDGASAHVLPFVVSKIESAGINPLYRELPKNYPGANTAFDTLNLHLNDIAARKSQPTMAEIMQMKDEISKARGSVRGVDDSKATEAIIRGFKDSVYDAVSKGKYEASPETVLAAGVELARADKGWSKFVKDYQPKAGVESSPTRRILSQFADPNSKYMAKEITPEMTQAAQTEIDKFITHPRVGPSLYNRMERMIGPGTPEMDAFNASIINKMLTAEKNDISKLPTQIQRYTTPQALPVTLKAFGANEGKLNTLVPHASDSAETAAAKQRLLDTQKLGQAIEIISKRPGTSDEKQSMIATAVKEFALPLAGFAFGFPHGAEAVMYALMGKGASSVGSSIGSIRASSAQRAGAPRGVQPETAGSPIPVGRGEMTPVIQNIPGILPPDREPNYGLPQARATGGRVTTSGQLMAAMERAGKKDVQNTKPLLQSTDTAVAKALEIANQHI